MKKLPKQNKVLLDFAKNPNSHKLPTRVYFHAIDHLMEIPASHKVTYRIDTKAKTLVISDLTARKQTTLGLKRTSSREAGSHYSGPCPRSRRL